MNWYSLNKLAKQLGMSVNTFKKHYLAKYPPDRETETYKGYTEQSLNRIKAELNKGAN